MAWPLFLPRNFLYYSLPFKVIAQPPPHLTTALRHYMAGPLFKSRLWPCTAASAVCRVDLIGGVHHRSVECFRQLQADYAGDERYDAKDQKVDVWIQTTLNRTTWHTHTRLTALFPVLPGWAGTRKAKPIWILLKQETVSGSGINWAICKSASRSRQITTPAPHQSVFTGRMPFLPPNQQRQSTEGKTAHEHSDNVLAA